MRTEKTNKKWSSVRCFPLLFSNFLPKLQRARAMPQFYMLFYANYTILATQRGGAWHHGSPLNTTLPEDTHELNYFCTSNMSLKDWFPKRNQTREVISFFLAITPNLGIYRKPQFFSIGRSLKMTSCSCLEHPLLHFSEYSTN